VSVLPFPFDFRALQETLAEPPEGFDPGGLVAPSADAVRAAVLDAGHAWFETPDRPYNVNLVALRTPPRAAGHFDDAVTLTCHGPGGEALFYCWQATTDPGLTWLQDPTARADGIAIRCPGQVRGSHMIRMHGSRRPYEALGQHHDAVIPVWRDGNHDATLDTGGRVHFDAKGLNWHRASAHRETRKIGAYSAGCTVLNRPADFALFMSLLHEAADRWGNRCTTTLIDWPTEIWPREVTAWAA